MSEEKEAKEPLDAVATKDEEPKTDMETFLGCLQRLLQEEKSALVDIVNRIAKDPQRKGDIDYTPFYLALKRQIGEAGCPLVFAARLLVMGNALLYQGGGAHLNVRDIATKQKLTDLFDLKPGTGDLISDKLTIATVNPIPWSDFMPKKADQQSEPPDDLSTSQVQVALRNIRAALYNNNKPHDRADETLILGPVEWAAFCYKRSFEDVLAASLTRQGGYNTRMPFLSPGLRIIWVVPSQLQSGPYSIIYIEPRWEKGALDQPDITSAPRVLLAPETVRTGTGVSATNIAATAIDFFQKWKDFHAIHLVSTAFHLGPWRVGELPRWTSVQLKDKPRPETLERSGYHALHVALSLIYGTSIETVTLEKKYKKLRKDIEYLTRDKFKEDRWKIQCVDRSNAAICFWQTVFCGDVGVPLRFQAEEGDSWNKNRMKGAEFESSKHKFKLVAWQKGAHSWGHVFLRDFLSACTEEHRIALTPSHRGNDLVVFQFRQSDKNSDFYTKVIGRVVELINTKNKDRPFVLAEPAQLEAAIGKELGTRPKKKKNS